MIDSILSIVFVPFTFPPVEFACAFVFVACLFSVVRNFLSGHYFW